MPIRLFLLALVTLGLAACRDCDGLGTIGAQGVIEPPIYDFGPITTGATCTGTLAVKNVGESDLRVNGASLLDSNGSFTLLATPELVQLGGTGDLTVQYKAEGDVGARQQTTIQVKTNDPDEGGVLTATASALVAGEPSAVAKTRCDKAGAETSPCTELAFGAAAVDNPALPIDARQGLTLSLTIVNDGNKDMVVSSANVLGNADIAFMGARQGSVVKELPFTVPAGRSGECGELLPDVDNTLVLDVKYSPTALGADVATMLVETDAIEANGTVGGSFELPISGVGSDTGLVVSPDYVVFSDVAEGSTATETIRVANVGSSEARVDESCIDLDGDDSCDALCTGATDEVASGLSCKVKRTDGSAEGKGFVLAATDASAGGDDERDIEITFAPTAGAATIPGGTTLRMASNILGDRVYTVAIGGGSLGILSATSPDTCGAAVCLQAESATPEDEATWTGTTTIELENTGDASLSITAFTWEASSTIIDDFTLLDGANPVNLTSPGITLAPNDTKTLTVAYANNDASQQDPVNLVVDHSGLGAQVTIEVLVLAP